MPPTMPATCEPAGAAERKAAAAAEREPCLRRAARRPGDGGVHVELVGVGGVHARDHGGDQVIEHLLAHAQAHELAQGLRLLAHGGGQEAVQLGTAQTALTDDRNQRLIAHIAGNTHNAGAGGAAGSLRQVQPGTVGIGG